MSEQESEKAFNKTKETKSFTEQKKRKHHKKSVVVKEKKSFIVKKKVEGEIHVHTYVHT